MLLKHTNLFKFANFYHPCKFNLNIPYLQKSNCPLAAYVNVYRHHGHYFANLDPLALYNRTNQQFVRPNDLQLKFQDNPSSYPFSTPLTRLSATIEELQIDSDPSTSGQLEYNSSM